MPSLAGDLKNIRRDRKLSIQDMYELTRIPLDTIKAIEDGTLFEDENRNSTYIRSFVRTYAKSLKISEEDIVSALDDHIIGVYNGFLFDKYGPGPSSTERKGGESDSESSRKTRYGSRFKLDLPEEESGMPEKEGEGEARDETESVIPLQEEEEEEDFFAESKPEEPEEEKRDMEQASSPRDQKVFSLPDPGKPYNRKVPEPPSVKSVDWASVVKRTYSLGRRPGFLLLILVIIIVLAGGIFVVVREMGQSSNKRSGTGISRVDSLATPALMTRSDSVKAGLLPASGGGAALPDTLRLTVYAAFGPLSPVRVQTDLARKMNPYWIDEGEGMRFNFRDSVEIRGVFSNMILLYNGHPLDDFRKHIGENGIFHIERLYFKEHPQWQTVTHDTLPGGVPQPSVVHSQPRY